MSVSSPTSNAQSIVNPISNFVIPQISRRQCGPFCAVDTFLTSMEFLDIASIRRVAGVCKDWNQALEEPAVWKRMSEIEGIPLVESDPFVIKLNDEVIATCKKETRNYKTDLQTLYPITTSGWQITQTFGRPVGKTPAIAEKFFLMLSMQDPFEPNKLMGETFQFVCRYSFVERILDEKTPLTQDELGNLIVTLKEASDDSCSSRSTKQQPVGGLNPAKIAFSLKNLRTLSLYPLNGQENKPVFGEDSYPPVFEQCDTCISRNGVYFMRKQIAAESRNKPFTEQLALVKDRGLCMGATPLEVRTLYAAVSILKGTCPDGRNPFTYERSSNTVTVNDHDYKAVSGAFGLGIGLCVHADAFVGGYFGIAPGVSAEAAVANVEAIEY